METERFTDRFFASRVPTKAWSQTGRSEDKSCDTAKGHAVTEPVNGVRCF
jgi:hypothetical protein